MPSYSDLSPANYYLIKENDNAGIELVYVPMVTNKCVLVEYQDDEQTMNWYKKTDAIFEIIEQLTDEQAIIFESLFEEDEEDWESDDIDEEDMDDEISDLWDEDDEAEDPALKN